MEYFVIMIDYGRRGCEAVVDPEMTYANVVDRVASGEYKNIIFIHKVLITQDGSNVQNITEEVMEAADASDRPYDFPGDHQSARWDHARDLRKHEVA